MAGAPGNKPPGPTPPPTMPAVPLPNPTPQATASVPTPTMPTPPVIAPSASTPATQLGTGPRYGQGWLKLVLAVVLAGLTCWCVAARTAHYREAQAAAAQAPTSSTAKTEPNPAHDVEKAAPEMKATNELLISWTVALLGATIGIAVLAKGAKIKDRNWGLVPFPSAWVFLLASADSGYEFKRSLTYQTAKGELSLPGLNLPLYLQWIFFRSALIVLGFVGLWYLFFRFSLAEEKSKGGDAC